MSEDLSKGRCLPCEGGVPPLAPDEARALLDQLDPAWRLAEDGKEIRRRFEFHDFYETMAFVNALAYVAHGENHHPDLEVSWGKCLVRWSTHAARGLTRNDFICAARTDALLRR